MLKNYFKIAWRNLIKNKVYSLLNISGLAIGMAVALLIGLWVSMELSFNKFLPKYEQLYLTMINYTTSQEGTYTQTSVSLPMVEVFRKEIPEIKNVAECDWINEHSLVVGEKKVLLNGAMIGPDFLTMFEYPMIKGHAATALKETYSIVLTESTAKALFGDEDPMNKLVKIDNEHNLTVTGILKDIPSNSTLKFSYLVPFKFYSETVAWIKQSLTMWDNQSNQMFVELNPGVTVKQVAPKIKDIIKKKFPNAKSANPEVFLQPLKDWNLYSEYTNGKCTGGYIDYVRMFSIIGILVLIIACINFMNLSTARSAKRAKEVGVRKAIGSQRMDLITQFLAESVLIVFIAFLFSLCLVQLALPFFNELTGVSIHIPFNNGVFWVIMLGYVLFTGLLAGSRPAFYLSSFHPVKVLKGTMQSSKAITLSRKSLVVLQFSCSIVLIISTLIIYQQIQFAKNRSKGYDSKRLMINALSNDLEKNYDALKNDLIATGMLQGGIERASSPVSYLGNNTSLDDWPGKSPGTEQFRAGLIWASRDYFKMLGMDIIAGKDFSTVSPDDTTSIIVNEALVKNMGLKDPVNQFIKMNKGKTFQIIGVVKNAVMRSPYASVDPVIFHNYRMRYETVSYMFYRLKPSVNAQDAIRMFTKIFDTYNPAYPYNYSFADEDYEYKFQMETLVGKLSGIFAALAVFISCLGLFGLAAFTAEQRTKEIGVRKILGASGMQLWLLLCKDFVLLVLISNMIACPLAFYSLQNWLSKYDYRISITPAVFILAAAGALLITLLTISYQAIRAAISNPVKSLRTE
jgi:putative ABC transport system permease protein